MVTVAVLLSLAPAAAGQWTLNDGTKMSFVFVQPSQKQAWRPNGDAIPYESLPRPTAAVWSAKDSDPVLVALINPGRGPNGDPTVRFKLPATEQENASFSLPCTDKRIWMAGYKPTTTQPSEQDLAIGVADGFWKVVNWIEFHKSGNEVHAVKQHGERVRLSVSGSGPTMAGPYTYVVVPATKDLANVAFRVTVKARDGSEMEYLQKWVSPDGTTRFQFHGLVDTVSRVITQIRPFEWHTLRVAHFRPSSN